jgi:hypothetical protein
MINKFVLIIGAMKCGTTSLFRYLAEHPQICPCEPAKEPHFFSNDKTYSKGVNWYQQLWAYDPNIHRIALEGSTTYTKMHTSTVVERISQFQTQFACDFRFIYVMRDPIERIESHYTHALSAPWGKTITPLNKGVDQRLIEVSKYAKQLDFYCRRFSKEQLILLNFNDLRNNALQLLDYICRWLELDTSYEFKNTFNNYHPTKGKVIEGKLWPLIKPVAEFLPNKHRDRLKHQLGHTITHHVKLSQEQRKFVYRELRDDLYRLEVNYGFDISGWECR